jgi:hypothetical protein
VSVFVDAYDKVIKQRDAETQGCSAAERSTLKFVIRGLKDRRKLLKEKPRQTLGSMEDTAVIAMYYKCRVIWWTFFVEVMKFQDVAKVIDERGPLEDLAQPLHGTDVRTVYMIHIDRTSRAGGHPSVAASWRKGAECHFETLELSGDTETRLLACGGRGRLREDEAIPECFNASNWLCREDQTISLRALHAPDCLLKITAEADAPGNQLEMTTAQVPDDWELRAEVEKAEVAGQKGQTGDGVQEECSLDLTREESERGLETEEIAIPESPGLGSNWHADWENTQAADIDEQVQSIGDI